MRTEKQQKMCFKNAEMKSLVKSARFASPRLCVCVKAGRVSARRKECTKAGFFARICYSGGMESLNIIGAGNVGKSLGRVWARGKLLAVRGVLNRTLESAERAVEFIGQGRPVTRYDELPESGWVMISVPDDLIGSVCAHAAAAGALRPGAVVFHCSGSRSSSLLEPARHLGCQIASIHPVKSFADPAQSALSFAQTPCGVEGDEEACRKIEHLAASCGAKPFRVNSDSKLLYHAGTVMVCNYLTALLESGFRCFEAAGIPRSRAMELAAPIIAETIKSNYALGPAAALTGPIARGDAQLVADQLEAVRQWDPSMAVLYKALGTVAVELSRTKGAASAESLGKIEELINPNPSRAV